MTEIITWPPETEVATQEESRPLVLDSTITYITVQCSCTGQILTRLDNTQLVAGQVDKIIVAFGLTEEWSGMSIVARFCRDLQSEIYDISLTDNYEVEIPHEVMDFSGSFIMSLRGEKDNRVITSNTVSYQVLDTVLGPNASRYPTETVYDKIDYLTTKCADLEDRLSRLESPNVE